MNRSGLAIGSIVLANTGLLVWASCFGILYAGLSLGCAAELHMSSWFGRSNALSALLVLATVAHIALLLWFLWYLQRGSITPATASPHTQRFFSRLAVVITITGILGVLWTALPVLLLPPCKSQGLG